MSAAGNDHRENPISDSKIIPFHPNPLDPKSGMRPEEWVARAAVRLHNVLGEWDSVPAADAAEERRRREVAQVAVNLSELHGRMTAYSPGLH